MEAVRRREGAGYGLGQERAVGVVLSRTKAFTDTFFGGDGGGTFVAMFSLLGGTITRQHVPSTRESLR